MNTSRHVNDTNVKTKYNNRLYVSRLNTEIEERGETGCISLRSVSTQEPTINFVRKINISCIKGKKLITIR